MTGLRDTTVERLRRSAGHPELASERYLLGEEIGRGGMGIVYAATDTELDREVAIKVPTGIFGSDVERRLQREARVLARLEHPGIVPVHDAGRLVDGRLFYVMKRVRGRTLREQLPAMPSLAERLRVFERLCEPVAFAHDAGVIHGDLKPENVMIGAFGEVIVMDWGLARLVGGDADDGGTIAGTPGFMAPEHARDGRPLDVRADVFGLGAVLFLLLTGTEPGAGDAPAAIRQRSATPKALRSICATALDPDPGKRYPTVAALAADVARVRAGEPASAHRESLIERAVRVARTHRVAILLVLAYLVMRVAVALLAGW